MATAVGRTDGVCSWVREGSFQAEIDFARGRARAVADPDARAAVELGVLYLSATCREVEKVIHYSGVGERGETGPSYVAVRTTGLRARLSGPPGSCGWGLRRSIQYKEAQRLGRLRPTCETEWPIRKLYANRPWTRDPDSLLRLIERLRNGLMLKEEGETAAFDL